MFIYYNIGIKQEGDEMKTHKCYWMHPATGNFYHKKSGKRASSVRQWILSGKV